MSDWKCLNCYLFGQWLCRLLVLSSSYFCGMFCTLRLHSTSLSGTQSIHAHFRNGLSKPRSAFSFTGVCSLFRVSILSGSGGHGKELAIRRQLSLWKRITLQISRMLILHRILRQNSSILMNGLISSRLLEPSKAFWFSTRYSRLCLILEKTDTKWLCLENH